MRSLTALCLTSALGLAAASPAWAALSYAGTGSYNLGSSSPPGNTVAASSSCGGTGQDTLEFTNSGVNGIGIHAYSCDYGSVDFGSRSSGVNTYYAQGIASVTGTMDVSDLGAFSFFINSGQVGAFGSTAFAAGEFQKASLTIKLIIDGTTYLDEAWSAEVGPGNTVLSNYASSGSDNVSYTQTSGDGYFNWGILGGFKSYDLGQGTHNIFYEMVSTASGNITSTVACNAALYAGPQAARGDGQVQIVEGPGAGDPFVSYCGAGAQSGDPFSQPIAIPFDGDLPVPLPEPAGLPLVAGALLAAFGVRRAVKR